MDEIQEGIMFIDLLEKRRSIRRFSDKSVEAEKVEKLVEAALRSPSGRGFNPWSFVVVDDRESLKRLSQCKAHGASFIKNAPLGIVVCADPGKSDTYVEDASIASIFIHLAAASLGLGSCWVQVRLRQRDDGVTAQDYVAKELGVPEGQIVQAIIAIGYPAETKAGHTKESLDYHKVFRNTFDTQWR